MKKGYRNKLEHTKKQLLDQTKAQKKARCGARTRD
jgi:hypothetical protein